MTKTEINSMLDMFTENIRECNFDHKLRFKSYDVDFQNDEIYLEWCTQEECYDHESFDQELIRAAHVAGFHGTINVHLFDRDECDSFNYELDA